MTSRSIFPPNCSRIFFSCSHNPIMEPHWKWQRNISMVSDGSPFVAIRNCSFCGFSGDASNLPIKEKQHYSLGLHLNKSHLTIGQLSSIITTIDFFPSLPAAKLNRTLYVLLFFLFFFSLQSSGQNSFFLFKAKIHHLSHWHKTLSNFKNQGDEDRMFTLRHWILKSHKFSLRSVDIGIRFTMDICQRLFD